MAHVVVIARVMLTRMMRQGVIVRMLLVVALGDVLDALVFGALRLLLPLVVGGLFGVVKLRLPLRGESQAAAALRHLLQRRDVLVVDQRELRNRMISIGSRAVQALQIDARPGVWSVASLTLAPLAAAGHNLHIVLEWLVVVVARRPSGVLAELVHIGDAGGRRGEDPQAPISGLLLLGLSWVDVLIVVVV